MLGNQRVGGDGEALPGRTIYQKEFVGVPGHNIRIRSASTQDPEYAPEN